MPRILVIDDDTTYRRSVLSALRVRGYETLEADNGVLGQQLALRYHPDVILCDLHMEHGDGYTLLAAIRSNPSTAPVPVILMTGTDREGTAFRRSMESGADDYLAKPFTAGTLYAAISACLRKQQTIRAIERMSRQAIDALGAHIAVLDHQGVILAANRAWMEYAQAMPPMARRLPEGVNYIEACASASGSGAELAHQAAAGMRAVLEGRQECFSMEYPCASSAGVQWFQMRVSRFEADGARRLVVTHEDITCRKQAEATLARARDYYVTLFEHFPALIWQADPQGRYSYFNRPWLDFTGESLEAQCAGGFAEAVHPDDFARWQQAFEDGVRLRAPFEREYRLRRYDGAYRWVRDRARPFHDPDGRFAGFLGVCTDVTEQQASQAALERRLSVEELVAQISTRLTSVDSHALEDELPRILRVMGQFIRADRCTLYWAELGQSGIKRIDDWHTEGLASHREFWQGRKISRFAWTLPKLRRGQPIVVPRIEDLPAAARIERLLWRRAGYRSVLMVPVAIGGEWCCAIEAATQSAERDWTSDDLRLMQLVADVLGNALGRHRAEAELQARTRQVEELNRRLSAAAHEIKRLMISVIERHDLNARFHNPHLQPCWEVKQCGREECPAYANSENLRCWQMEGTHCAELAGAAIDRKQGLCSQCEVYQAARADTVIDLGETFNDMIAILAERERALEEQQRRLRTLLDALPGFAWLKDAQGRYLAANRPFCQLAGTTPEAIVGRTSSEVLPSDMADQSCRTDQEIFRGAQQSVIEEQTIQVDGQPRTVSVRKVPLTDEQGRVVGLIGLGFDITERKQAELERAEHQRQELHSQKLESIGQLAAGIAHEINTPTQFIGDNTRFLQDGFQELEPLLRLQPQLLEAIKARAVSDELLQQFEQALQAADLDYLLDEIPQAIAQSLEGVARVSKIVRAMKEFSHPGETEKTPTDLNHLIETTITVARNEWKYVAEMETDFQEDLPAVPCVPGEFNQVILNLVVNAAHAIAEVVGDGGQGKGRITIRTRHDGDWVEVRISDTGCGIPEEVRHRVFDPFFTTKPVGKGTGQGLAIARSVIVDKHGGTIDFESAPGRGTTFIIRLPLQEKQGQRQRAA